VGAVDGAGRLAAERLVGIAEGRLLPVHTGGTDEVEDVVETHQRIDTEEGASGAERPDEVGSLAEFLVLQGRACGLRRDAVDDHRLVAARDALVNADRAVGIVAVALAGVELAQLAPVLRLEPGGRVVDQLQTRQVAGRLGVDRQAEKRAERDLDAVHDLAQLTGELDVAVELVARDDRGVDAMDADLGGIRVLRVRSVAGPACEALEQAAHRDHERRDLHLHHLDVHAQILMGVLVGVEPERDGQTPAFERRADVEGHLELLEGIRGILCTVIGSMRACRHVVTSLRVSSPMIG
jgi:hypothetical protein